MAVVSDKLAKNMFGDTDPLMQELKVNRSDKTYTYTIVGVYKYEESVATAMMNGGATSEKDKQTDLYIPVTVAQQINGNQNYSMMTVMAKTGVAAGPFSEKIENYFDKYYRNSDYNVEKRKTADNYIVYSLPFYVKIVMRHVEKATKCFYSL